MFGLTPFSKESFPKDPFNALADAFREPLFHNMAPFSAIKVDVKDTGEAYEIAADLPGAKKEDIALRYENNYLTIEAKYAEKKDEEKDGYIRRERSTGTLTRSFYIDGIDKDNISAEFKDGVLVVNLPKLKDGAAAKPIAIR